MVRHERWRGEIRARKISALNSFMWTLTLWISSLHTFWPHDAQQLRHQIKVYNTIFQHFIVLAGFVLALWPLCLLALCCHLDSSVFECLSSGDDFLHYFCRCMIPAMLHIPKAIEAYRGRLLKKICQTYRKTHQNRQRWSIFNLRLCSLLFVKHMKRQVVTKHAINKKTLT